MSNTELFLIKAVKERLFRIKNPMDSFISYDFERDLETLDAKRKDYEQFKDFVETRKKQIYEREIEITHLTEYLKSIGEDVE